MTEFGLMTHPHFFGIHMESSYHGVMHIKLAFYCAHPVL